MMSEKQFNRIYDSIQRGGMPALIGYDIGLSQLNLLLPMVKNEDYAIALKCHCSEYLKTK